MTENQLKAIIPDWAMTVNCAITVCDRDGIVLYMNEKSRETFARSGGAALIGQSLLPCHNPRSKAMMRHMLETGDTNVYTITKHGQRKLIYQTPWRTPDGNTGGLVEISIILPDNMPHYTRD